MCGFSLEVSRSVLHHAGCVFQQHAPDGRDEELDRCIRTGQFHRVSVGGGGATDYVDCEASGVASVG